MSAWWGVLYLNVEHGAAAVLDAVDRACGELVDGRAYAVTVRDGHPVWVSCDEHDVIRAPGRDAVGRASSAGDPCLVVYPRHEGLVAIGLLGWFSPDQILDATPEGWAHRAARAAEERRRGTLAGGDAADETRVEAIPRVALRLSAELAADAALLLFLRNPSVMTTSVWLARGGRWIDAYFRRDFDGRIDTLRLAPRAGELFGGRFAFLGQGRPPAGDDEDGVAFHAEHLALSPQPEWSTYDSSAARLYVPYWVESLRPVGIVVYDRDALLAPPDGPAAIRAVLPRPSHAIDPNAPDRDARLLRLLTRNVPLDRAGLQFRDEASGKESIVFAMEVDWLSPRRVELDMRRVEPLLWPGRALTLRARIIDCEGARYGPLTPWSEPFLRLGKRG